MRDGHAQTAAGNTLALQVDADGNVNYGAIGTFLPLSPRSCFPSAPLD